MFAVFKIDGVVGVLTVSDELLNLDLDRKKIGIPENTPYFIKEKKDIPDAPIEAWVLLDDGSILVDSVRLFQYTRQNMPQLTPIEFDIKLNNAGLYDAVQELIKDSFDLRIAYNRAAFFSRTDAFIDQARVALGLTDEQVDTIWLDVE